MAKVIQITATGHANTMNTQSDWTLFALCDDGSIWMRDSSGTPWCQMSAPDFEKTTAVPTAASEGSE